MKKYSEILRDMRGKFDEGSEMTLDQRLERETLGIRDQEDAGRYRNQPREERNKDYKG